MRQMGAVRETKMRDEARAREEDREIYTGGGRQREPRERDECVLD